MSEDVLERKLKEIEKPDCEKRDWKGESSDELAARFLAMNEEAERRRLIEEDYLLKDDDDKLIDTSQFSFMSLEELSEILALTIKHDETQKLITFLCMLSAYTESSQFNLSFNSPSATGKSYIPLELAQLFPPEDVIELAYCSPTAFFHDVGRFSKTNNEYVVNLSRRILILLDMPHSELLAKLRPLFSHDKKEIKLKITDKGRRFGLKTKNVKLLGYPAVIFCSASMKIDEQEATRFLLLSPDTTKEKLLDAVNERIKRESNGFGYRKRLEQDAKRELLKKRILAIKRERISDVKIDKPHIVAEKFLIRNDNLKPRHTRDVGRIMSLIKAVALLNLWFKQRDGDIIVAEASDIKEGFRLYDQIRVSQELNIPPYVYEIYKNVIVEAWREKYNINGGGLHCGLTKKEITKWYYDAYKRYLPEHQLTREILPALELAGLIQIEPDPTDKRRVLINPC